MAQTQQQPPSSVPQTPEAPKLAPPPPPDSQIERQTSNGGRPRRGSFGFLRRSKSGEMSAARANSTTNKLTRRRKSVSKEEERRQQEAAARARQPPQLPSHTPFGHNLDTPFGLNDGSSTSAPYNPTAYYNRYTHMDRSAVSPGPPSSHGGAHSFDPYAGTESMTNRGRYSYASSLISTTNNPRRVRRRKDPTPFNVLVIGTKNCGKTSFIEFLRSALTRPIRPRVTTPPNPDEAVNPNPSSTNSSFTSQYLETDLEGERIALTLWDSKGLETHLVDLQLRELSSFIESGFQETFNEEQKVVRNTGITDKRIHCVFLMLDPSRLDTNIAASGGKQLGAKGSPGYIGSLDEQLDVDVIRTLQGKTMIVPVISKADTITTAHMSHLKRNIWESFKKMRFDPLESLKQDSDGESDLDEEDEDALEEILEDAKEHQDEDSDSPEKPTKNAGKRLSLVNGNSELPPLPFSIISPDVYDPGTVGRRFPWGFADPYKAEHCDFVRLKDSVFSEWRQELRVAARERWYENWRTTRLRKRGQMSTTATSSYIPPSSPSAGGRVVSPAAAYGSPPGRSSAKKERVVSASEIGVAIGADAPIAPNTDVKVDGY